jgi:hypothetical protein
MSGTVTSSGQSRSSGAAWQGWYERIWQLPLGGDRIQARLLAIAEEIRSQLVPTRRLAEEWKPLGVDLRLVPMTARGSARQAGGTKVVFINASDPHELQRFTMAHEVAHLLLTPPDLERDVLHPAVEERLCETFASELLMPQRQIAQHLGGGRPTPEDILRLCGEYRVNVRPMMRALGKHIARDVHLLLARWRGHPRRLEAVAFRIDGSAGDQHLFFPRDQRLSTVGLTNLAYEGGCATHGDCVEGHDEDVVIELRGLDADPPSRSVVGQVFWQMARQGKDDPYLLAVLDLKDVMEDIQIK